MSSWSSAAALLADIVWSEYQHHDRVAIHKHTRNAIFMGGGCGVLVECTQQAGLHMYLSRTSWQYDYITAGQSMGV
jgi:hypothetical protein